MKNANRNPSALLLLVRDYGFDVRGKDLVMKGLRGFSSDRVIRRVRGEFDAAEQLIPIIGEDSYQARFMRITCPA